MENTNVILFVIVTEYILTAFIVHLRDIWFIKENAVASLEADHMTCFVLDKLCTLPYLEFILSVCLIRAVRFHLVLLYNI